MVPTWQNPLTLPGFNPLAPAEYNPLAPGGFDPLSLLGGHNPLLPNIPGMSLPGGPGGTFNPSPYLNTDGSWAGSVRGAMTAGGEFLATNPNWLAQHNIPLNLGPDAGQNLQNWGNSLGMFGGGMQATSGIMDVYGALNGDLSVMEGATGAGNVIAGGSSMAVGANGLGLIDIPQANLPALQALALAPDALNFGAAMMCGETHEQFVAGSQLGVNALGTAFAPVGAGMAIIMFGAAALKRP